MKEHRFHAAASALRSPIYTIGDNESAVEKVGKADAPDGKHILVLVVPGMILSSGLLI